eukprot:TRINITY_DN4714_c0_g1_i6.p1 TRINITY_DN4714_c0_g1~~TRINITY_DN4714_c0_g1_i6.p1  ORF type:complete len:403 (+),score=84.96 TRINITY_DN4714_c0_g1_i6:85-1293(+)
MAEFAMLLRASERNEKSSAGAEEKTPFGGAGSNAKKLKQFRVNFNNTSHPVSVPSLASDVAVEKAIRSTFRLTQQAEFGLKTPSGTEVAVNALQDGGEYFLFVAKKQTNSETSEPELGLLGGVIKKRKRRKAAEIERSYKCNVPNCHKYYGSENALKMHVRLKHPELLAEAKKNARGPALNPTTIPDAAVDTSGAIYGSTPVNSFRTAPSFTVYSAPVGFPLHYNSPSPPNSTPNPSPRIASPPMPLPAPVPPSPSHFSPMIQQIGQMGPQMIPMLNSQLREVSQRAQLFSQSQASHSPASHSPAPNMQDNRGDTQNVAHANWSNAPVAPLVMSNGPAMPRLDINSRTLPSPIFRPSAEVSTSVKFWNPSSLDPQRSYASVSLPSFHHTNFVNRLPMIKANE